MQIGRTEKCDYIEKDKNKEFKVDARCSLYETGREPPSNDSSQDLFCWESGWKFDDYESVKQ